LAVLSQSANGYSHENPHADSVSYPLSTTDALREFPEINVPTVVPPRQVPCPFPDLFARASMVAGIEFHPPD
ncbi:MAG TPA: hypothetical protein PK955_06790, partial [Methanoregulaceae archaeon]|nr:hypothetical protein [Methanoregulaceae archaeon]